MIYPVSSAYNLSFVSFAWPNTLATDFEQVIIPVICGCVKRVHLVTDDGLYDGKPFTQ